MASICCRRRQHAILLAPLGEDREKLEDVRQPPFLLALSWTGESPGRVLLDVRPLKMRRPRGVDQAHADDGVRARAYVRPMNWIFRPRRESALIWPSAWCSCRRRWPSRVTI